MAYNKENDPSNPDAYPLYNNNMLKFWNWFDDVWNCNDWIVYHKAVKTKYGKPKADETFLAFWNDLATGSNAIGCRSLDSAFRDYMKKENLLDSLFSGIGIIAKPIGMGTDIVTSVGNSVSNAGKGIEGATKVLKIAVPLMLVVAIGFGGYWAYGRFIKKTK